MNFTGLVCPYCTKQVAYIEHKSSTVTALHCPVCGRRWIATTPAVPSK